MSKTKAVKSHSPQDELYGPLYIPNYCWPIIDTAEFQRLRHILQLATVNLVFPGATHTRFEHCLGCAHLAYVFMQHLQAVQPELKIEPKHTQALVIGALCHDLGHGPWSHTFESIAHVYDEKWDHEEMSKLILRHIWKNYNLQLEKDVIEAACSFISGKTYEGYPEWLAEIIANKKVDIDIDKFDYLARDMNRCLSVTGNEYDRLIIHCRIVEGRLAWRMSEIPTIERVFYNRNDMHQRVYQHRVVQTLEIMVKDMLEYADQEDYLPYPQISEALDDPSAYAKLDDRMLYSIELGHCGKKAQKIALKMKVRDLYRCVGELRVRPDNKEGLTYSQLPTNQLEEDIASFGNCPAKKIRVGKMHFRYGLTPDSHPLLGIPFWKPGCDHIIKLSESDISCIVPAHFREVAMRVFVTADKYVEPAKIAFEKWKQFKCIQ